MQPVKSVDILPTDVPELSTVEKVGEGVYLGETVRFAERQFRTFILSLSDDVNGLLFPNTGMTTAMVLGEGNSGRDHWGWPGEPFADAFVGAVLTDGRFFLHLEDVSSSTVVSGVFRWIRNGKHGTTARMWRWPS